MGLEFYGALKGMNAQSVRSFADVMTHALDMTDHRNKLSKTLSGGNKRKLSLAISMMGSPDVLMLDEPSAGIDPAARSNMVDILKQVKQEPGARRCIVLTTHLMEEAEALCDRVGIMVNGKLEAVGSLTHLKSRFGKFWQIFVAQTESAAAAGGGREKLGEFMRSLHPDAKVLESHLASSMWRV